MKTAAAPARRHVRAAALAHYFEVAEAVGLNPQPLLRRMNLSRRMLVDLEQPIPLAAAVQLLEESAHASGCADFGLRMAEARRLSDLGTLSLLLTHLPNLRAVLQTMIRSGQLVSGSLALALVETGKTTAIREEMVVPGIRPSRQAAELALGVLFRLCASLPGSHWHPQSVHFRHAAPADVEPHRRLFRCRLKFRSAFDGVVCATADLDRLPPTRRQRGFTVPCALAATTGQMIEALGVPCAVVKLILVNGESAGFENRLRDGDRVAAYPAFETLDLTPIDRGADRSSAP
jgi:hypothetical protein